MYEPQHLFDLQDNHGSGGTDPKSWLSGVDDHLTASSPSILQRNNSSLSTASSAGNFDRVLYKDLVEMMPLVQSLIENDRRVNTSFTRRGSMIYTKTPSRELLTRKTFDAKARNGTQSIPTKMYKDQSKKPGANRDGNSENLSMLSSNYLPSEKDREELMALREQMEDLRRKLSEKDELLKSTEFLKDETASLKSKLDQIKIEAAEKDAILKSTQVQLSDTKIKLADKQAALEKLQWEAMTSKKRVERLQKDLEMMQGEISLYMLSFEELARNSSTSTFTAEDYEAETYPLDQHLEIDDMNDKEMQNIEAAREAYIAAVAAAKEKQDAKSIALAASARSHLQSFVLRAKSTDGDKGSPTDGNLRLVAETVAYI